MLFPAPVAVEYDYKLNIGAVIAWVFLLEPEPYTNVGITFKFFCLQWLLALEILSKLNKDTDSALPQLVFRIRVIFMRIRIQPLRRLRSAYPAIKINANLDPGKPLKICSNDQ
jgi:hypothetical protein